MTAEIVQIVQELSTVGGAETVALELARAFNRAGLANRVIASTVGTGVGSDAKVERIGAGLAKIPTRGWLRHIGRFLVVPLFTLAATRAVWRRPRSVIISHGDSLKGDVLVVHAVNAQNLKEKRRSNSWVWMLNPIHLWVAWRDRWMIGGLRYRIYVAVSPRVETELRLYYDVPPSRIRVIPNGIDLARFNRDPSAGRAIRREFGIPDDVKLLLFVGHEFRRKGLEHAIAALERLDSNVRLLVVGSDSQAMYRRMAKTSGDRLIFAGSRSDMPAFYAAADALVLPTNYETFSLVCMEAMAASLPVFATPVGGIEDYLVDGVNGYQITWDGEDIARKISAVFANPALFDALCIGARQTALGYGWDEVGSQYISLLEQIDAAKNPSPVAGLTAQPV